MADEFFAPPSGIDWQGHVGTVQYGNVQGQFALFYTHPVPNPAKSKEMGRPIFEDKVYVRIQAPGERLNVVDRPATEVDKQRFAQQWAQFNQHKQQTHEGTPIEMLYPERPSIAATLRAHNIFTIEQCSELSGPAIDSVGMGAQQWTNDAKRFVEIANKGVKANEMRAELEKRDSEIRVLKQQLERVVEALAESQKANQAAGNIDQLRQLISGAMERPVHGAGGFDSQAAMIAANHPTAQQQAPQAAKTARRQRAKLV